MKNNKSNESKVGVFLNKYGTKIVWIMSAYMMIMVIIAFLVGTKDEGMGKGGEPSPTEIVEISASIDEVSESPAAEETPSPTDTATVSEATATPETKDTPQETPAPEVTAELEQNSGDVTIWVNLETLIIRHDPSLKSGALGKIPYGTEMTGDVVGKWEDAQSNPDAQAWEVCDKWLHISYKGIDGYIFMGNTIDGRECVVYSADELE